VVVVVVVAGVVVVVVGAVEIGLVVVTGALFVLTEVVVLTKPSRFGGV
jgi:hypothetical protein